MFGQLRIVPSADLGQMGPQQGEAASFNWKWYYSASGFVIWLALILAVVIPKANHSLHVLWIFVPLVILNLLYLAFKQISNASSSSAVQFDTLFQSMVIGIAVLWLTANYLEKLGGAVRFFFSFGTVVIITSLGTLSYAGFSRDTFLFLVLFAVITLALLIAIAVSSILCRRRYKPGRFMLWLGLWILVGSILAVSVFYTVLILATGTEPSWSDFPQMILMLAVPGLIFGVFLYVLNLPFMILGFAHPFFRERFCVCLRLKSIPATAESEAGSDRLDNGQSPAQGVF